MTRDLNSSASMVSPLTPGEDEEARTIARQMITPMINPSADAIQLGYDCLLRTKYVGHERVSLALIELLDDPAPLTRLAAAVTLLQKGNGRHQACAAIDHVLKTCDVTLKIAAASLLSILEELPDELLATLKQLLEEEHRNLRIAVAAIMKDSPKSLPILSQALWDDNYGLAFMAAKGLIRRRIRVDDAMNSLMSRLGKVSDEWDAAIVGQLSELPEKADHIGPTLVRLLKDPKTPRMTRTVAASALGKIGHSAKAQAEFERALFASLRSGDWETVCAASTALQDLGVAPRKVIRALVELLSSSIMDARGMAAVILGEFGTRAADAVPALFEQVGVERNSDVLIALRYAIHSIGLPDASTDPQFFDATIAALVEQATAETDTDLLPFRLSMFTLFGTRAVPALIRLAQNNDMGSIRIAVATLAAIGLMSPDDVISQVVDGLIGHKDERVRMTGVNVLAEMGPSATAAVSKLAQLLSDGDEAAFPDALRALRAIGPGALEAAPAVLPLLSAQNQFVAARAEDALLAMGQDVRPLLEEACTRAAGDEQRRLASLLKRVGVSSTQVSSGTGEFAWISDDALLELFAAVGEILERDGPTSYRVLSKRLNSLADESLFKTDVKTSERNIALKIGKLEELLSEREGRPIKLTDRESTRKGGLTSDGKRTLRRVQEYLRTKYSP